MSQSQPFGPSLPRSLTSFPLVSRFRTTFTGTAPLYAHTFSLINSHHGHPRDRHYYTKPRHSRKAAAHVHRTVLLLVDERRLVSLIVLNQKFPVHCCVPFPRRPLWWNHYPPSRPMSHVFALLEPLPPLCLFRPNPPFPTWATLSPSQHIV